MIGKTLSHYKISGRLGKGGMGEVYLAEDTRLKRRVALKVLPPDLAADPFRLERFQREAEAIAALNHPNVVIIYSVEEVEGIRFLTMELVEGKTLAQILPTEGMDVESYFRFVIPVAEALSAAHEKGIIHRDLKPTNIMVSEEGRVKVLDFGLAKLHQSDTYDEASQMETSARTKEGVVLGTAPYMSPEQALGQRVDSRSDIFSFGIVLYELASGRLPFRGNSIVKILTDIVHTDAPALISKTAPPELERIIRRCLEKNPENRYRSMKDLLADLIPVKDRVLRIKGGVSERLKEDFSIHNLPVQVTSFIGREAELSELRSLISSHRLVTVIGAGGAGKTRLAFETAFRSLDDFSDGVWQVSLAPITTFELIVQSIVEALDAPKQANRPMLESVAAKLEGRNLLLIMDNCEHVLDEAASVVDTLLHMSPQIRILATSREGLNVSGEFVWTVPPLTLPPPHSTVTMESAVRCDAVRLFMERALAREPRFILNESNLDAVVNICRRLDGIPLAIELAAARIKVMSAEEIRKRLNDCFKLLTVGTRASLPRHQTLRAAVDWSYDLLSSEERLLYRRLAFFMGGFDFEALENVCGWGELNADNVLDHLTRLVDKSLVVSDRSADDSVRYRLLEPLRQYAMEKLVEAGEAESMAQRHLAYYASLADRAYEERIESSTSWLNRLELEHDNLRAALDWASAHDPESELRLAGALSWFWVMHSHFSEGRRLLRRVLNRKWNRTRELARALCGAASLAAFQGDHLKEHEPAEEGLAIWRELGDAREVALALEPIGWSLWFSNNNQAAMQAFQESAEIGRQLGDERLINRATLNICQVLVSEFDVDQAEPMAKKCLTTAIKYDEPRDIHFAHHFLADCALIRGDVVAARTKYSDSLRAALRTGDRIEILFEIEGIAMSLAGMERDEKAMRLKGAIEAEHEVLKSNMTVDFWETLKKRYLVPVENRLGTQAYEKARNAGRTMGFEAAIDYALAIEQD